jgi:hypothetical protein
VHVHVHVRVRVRVRVLVRVHVRWFRLLWLSLIWPGAELRQQCLPLRARDPSGDAVHPRPVLPVIHGGLHGHPVWVRGAWGLQAARPWSWYSWRCVSLSLFIIPCLTTLPPSIPTYAQLLAPHVSCNSCTSSTE